MTQRNDLFDNPMVRSAKNAMDADTIAHYQKMGESMFSIDFENPVPDKTMDDMVFDSITQSLRSGLPPKDLMADERTMLVDRLGETWYTAFGYTENDLN